MLCRSLWPSWMITAMSIMLPSKCCKECGIGENPGNRNSLKGPEAPQFIRRGGNKKGQWVWPYVLCLSDAGENVLLLTSALKSGKGQTLAVIGKYRKRKELSQSILIPRFYDVNYRVRKGWGWMYKKHVPGRASWTALDMFRQKGVLFPEPLIPNIRYGKTGYFQEGTGKEGCHGCPGLRDFIEEKTSRIWVSCSPGEEPMLPVDRSRELSIARAVAKDPEIFFFDDSFSAPGL